MNESDTFSSYTVVEPINDDATLPDLNSLLGILKRMRGVHPRFHGHLREGRSRP